MAKIYTFDGGLARIGNGVMGQKDHAPDPYNPLNLPSHTIRVRFSDNYTPSMGDSQTQVSVSPNIWDITKTGTSWYQLFNYNNDILEILGANASGVENFEMFCHYAENLESTVLFDTRDAVNVWNMYNKCFSLISIPDYQLNNATNCESFCFQCNSLVHAPHLYTPAATNMSHMFYLCTSMVDMPQLITTNVTDVTNMFYMCLNVESGIYDFYQQLSQQDNPPSSHSDCFFDCGSDTVTGYAELEQIPTSWGGFGRDRRPSVDNIRSTR